MGQKIRIINIYPSRKREKNQLSCCCFYSSSSSSQFTDKRSYFSAKPVLKQTYRVYFCFCRRFELHVAEAPDRIESLFVQYSENGIMTVHHLHWFLIEVRKEERATGEDARAIVDSLREPKHFNILHKKGLSFEVVLRYLCGDINPLHSPYGSSILSFSLNWAERNQRLSWHDAWRVAQF